MISVADTTGEAVEHAVEATDLVVAEVRLSSDEHLEVHEVLRDLVNILCYFYVIINMCFY